MNDLHGAESVSRCRGTGRTVYTDSWRSYFYCPVCRKRLHADDAHEVREGAHTRLIVPLHKPKAS